MKPTHMLFRTTTAALAKQVLRELYEEHPLKEVVFLVDHAKHLVKQAQYGLVGMED